MNASSAVVDQRIHLLRRHWKHHPLWETAQERHPADRQFTVAISREAGAAGMEIAHEIGQRLEWPVYDREIIDLIAVESGLREELVESLDERDRGWLVEAIASFKRRDQVSTAEFVHHLVHVLNALAAHGRCVIVGRGAAACLPRATTLRVRVVADLGDRVRRIAQEQRLTEEEAHDTVERIDRQRGKFVAGHFHRDILDAHNFDVVVNVSRLTPATCADVAVQALRALASSSATDNAASATPHATATAGV
jgi:cytidylate kinase